MHWVFLAVVLVLFVYHRTFRHVVSWSAVVSALLVGTVCVVASFSLPPRDDGLPQPLLVLGGGLVTGGVLALGGWGIWRVARQPGGCRRIRRGVGRWLVFLGLVGVLGAGLVLVGWVAWQIWLLPSLPQWALQAIISSLLVAVAFVSPVVVLFKSLDALSKNYSLWQMLRQGWRAAIECGCWIACIFFVLQLVRALTGRGAPNHAVPWTLATFAGYICGGIILLTFGVRALSLWLWNLWRLCYTLPRRLRRRGESYATWVTLARLPQGEPLSTDNRARRLADAVHMRTAVE